MRTANHLICLILLKTVKTLSILSYLSASVSDIRYEEYLENDTYTLVAPDSHLKYGLSFDDQGRIQIHFSGPAGFESQPAHYLVSSTRHLLFFPLVPGVDISTELGANAGNRVSEAVKRIVAQDLPPTALVKRLKFTCFPTLDDYVVVYCETDQIKPISLGLHEAKPVASTKIAGHDIYTLNLSEKYTVWLRPKSIAVNEKNRMVLRINNGQMDCIESIEVEESHVGKVLIFNGNEVKEMRKRSQIMPSDTIMVIFTDSTMEPHDKILVEFLGNVADPTPISLAEKMKNTNLLEKSGLMVLLFSGREIIVPQHHKCVYEARSSGLRIPREERPTRRNSRLSQRFDALEHGR